MHIFYHSGVKTTDTVDEIPRVGGVWYHSEGMANIQAMALIQNY